MFNREIAQRQKVLVQKVPMPALDISRQGWIAVASLHKFNGLRVSYRACPSNLWSFFNSIFITGDGTAEKECSLEEVFSRGGMGFCQVVQNLLRWYKAIAHDFAGCLDWVLTLYDQGGPVAARPIFQHCSPNWKPLHAGKGFSCMTRVLLCWGATHLPRTVLQPPVSAWNLGASDRTWKGLAWA